MRHYLIRQLLSDAGLRGGMLSRGGPGGCSEPTLFRRLCRWQIAGL